MIVAKIGRGELSALQPESAAPDPFNESPKRPAAAPRYPRPLTREMTEAICAAASSARRSAQQAIKVGSGVRNNGRVDHPWTATIMLAGVAAKVLAGDEESKAA